MTALETVLFVIVTVFVTSASSTANNSEIPDTAAPKEFKPSGALASFGRMVVDLPLGLVEAFKDVSNSEYACLGAEAIESVILGIVHTIFT